MMAVSRIKDFRLLNMFIVLITSYQARFSECSLDTCRKLPTPDVLDGTRDTCLDGHAYVNLKVRTLVICAVRCMLQKKCQSFNYDRAVMKCSLNDATHLQRASDMKPCPSSDMEYYDLSQWDQIWLGRCRNHNCPSNTICEATPGSHMIKCTATYSADILFEPTIPVIPIATITTPNPTTTPTDACTQSEGCANCTEKQEISIPHFSAIGCYHHDVLPTYQTEFINIEWNRASWFEAVVWLCAAMASPHQYELFGIQNFTHCHVGNWNDATFKNPIKATACDTDCLYKGVGVGSEDVMFVYKLD